MNERKEERQNPEWDPGKPSVARIAQVHCNLHTLCNAKSRRGRGAFKITFTAIMQCHSTAMIHFHPAKSWLTSET